MNITKNGSSVVIQFSKNNKSNYLREIFLHSIGECLNGTMGFRTDSTFYKCYFHAHSLSFLSTSSLNYDNVLQMITSLAKQQTYLHKIGNCGFYGLLYDEILVIDNSIYVCLDINLVQEMDDSSENIIFRSPFDKHKGLLGFYAPEILNIETLPSSVSYKVFHSSLAGLVIYCLFGKHIFENREEKEGKGEGEGEGEGEENGQDIERILTPIKFTKLYWFLLRLTSQDIEERNLILI
jgi:hypothetical protein